MGILEAAQPGSDAWWRNATRKIDELQRDLDELRAAVGSQGAVFSSEGITIRDGGSLTIEDDGDFVIGQDATLKVQSDDPEGEPIAQFGDVLRDGAKIGRGMSIDTSEGLRVATVSEDAASKSVFWEFRDAEQNIVIANDVKSGYGLKSPTLTFGVADWHFSTSTPVGEILGWPYTEAAGFRMFGLGENIPMIHPRLRIIVDGGNTPSSDVMVRYQIRRGSTEVIATSEPVSASGTWVYDWDVAAYPDRQYKPASLYFDMEKVSGSGRGYARVRSVSGRGSL